MPELLCNPKKNIIHGYKIEIFLETDPRNSMQHSQYFLYSLQYL